MCKLPSNTGTSYRSSRVLIITHSFIPGVSRVVRVCVVRAPRVAGLLRRLALLSVFFLSVYSQAEGTLDSSNSKKILVLGDSLSAAYKLPEEQGWVALMAQRIRERNYSVEVINASISGATTDAGINVLRAALEQHKPQLVLLELGANDGLQGKPIPRISANLEQLISMAKAADAEVLLIGIRLPPNLGKRYTEPFFQQYASLAKKHELALLPFLLEGVAGNPQLMLDDGLHPAAAGQPLILENVWPRLEPILRAWFSA